MWDLLGTGALTLDVGSYLQLVVDMVSRIKYRQSQRVVQESKYSKKRGDFKQISAI